MAVRVLRLVIVPMAVLFGMAVVVAATVFAILVPVLMPMLVRVRVLVPVAVASAGGDRLLELRLRLLGLELFLVHVDDVGAASEGDDVPADGQRGEVVERARQRRVLLAPKPVTL